jgi:hypothetical protein
MSRDDNNKRISNQPQNKHGLFGLYDENTPKPSPTKLTWFSDFAPFGIQFRYWFFILAAIIIVGLVFFFRYDPYADDRDALFNSIEILNKAILLTDPQQTGAYFSYYDENILAMFKKGIEYALQVNFDVFKVDDSLRSLEYPYADLIMNVERECYTYYTRLIRTQSEKTPEEQEYYQSQADFFKSIYFFTYDTIDNWIKFWNDYGIIYKEKYNLTIDDHFPPTK